MFRIEFFILMFLAATEMPKSTLRTAELTFLQKPRVKLLFAIVRKR